MRRHTTSFESFMKTIFARPSSRSRRDSLPQAMCNRFGKLTIPNKNTLLGSGADQLQGWLINLGVKQFAENLLARVRVGTERQILAVRSKELVGITKRVGAVAAPVVFAGSADCTGSHFLDTVLQLRRPFVWHKPDGLRGVT